MSESRFEVIRQRKCVSFTRYYAGYYNRTAAADLRRLLRHDDSRRDEHQHYDPAKIPFSASGNRCPEDREQAVHFLDEFGRLFIIEDVQVRYQLLESQNFSLGVSGNFNKHFDYGGIHQPVLKQLLAMSRLYEKQICASALSGTPAVCSGPVASNLTSMNFDDVKCFYAGGDENSLTIFRATETPSWKRSVETL